MNAITTFLTSSVGKKYLMSVTGLALFGFLVAHLLGNSLLLFPVNGHEYFNKYAHHLEELKWLVIMAEIGLLAIVGLHMLVGLTIFLGVKKARPQAYLAAEKTKGGDSHSNLSSRNMLILGLAIIAFVVFHVWTFKYGPGIKEGYVYKLDGADVRDLYLLVVRTFAKPAFLLIYVVALGFLGFHLRHGVWSAFQSLGAMPGTWSKSLYCAGAVVGSLIALGFAVLPIWIFAAAHLHLIKY